MTWDDVPEGYMSVPQPWTGTKEQLAANLKTHSFFVDDPEDAPVCDDCGCKLGHTTSKYRCGTNVPRIFVKAGSTQAQRAILNSIGLPANLLREGAVE